MNTYKRKTEIIMNLKRKELNKKENEGHEAIFEKNYIC